MPDLRPAILVVDDEPTVREILAAMVAHLGYRPLPAAGGAEAVGAYLSERPAPAAAVLDVRMPGMDGPATLTALRALNPALPCVFVSGDTGHHSAANLMARGAVAVLGKLVGLTVLGAALAAATGRAAGAGA